MSREEAESGGKDAEVAGIKCNVMSSRGEIMVAACDSELLGKEFSEDKKRLRVAECFYGSQTASEEELRILLAKATIANLTGERVVKIAIEMGLVEPENILMVDGVPHAQMARRL